MNYLSIIGLALDLAGVLLLGADVLRIQRKLKRDAVERLSSLNEVFEGQAGLEAWMEELARNADWREHQRDEGRYFPVDGTFDPSAAKESVREITAQISELGANVGRLAELQIAAAKTDQRTARSSLALTYTGLLMIVAGFALQIAGQWQPDLIG